MLARMRTIGLLCFVATATSLSIASAADPVVITAPADGSVVPKAFSVTVTYGDLLYCDTDGCFDTPAEVVSLFADSMSVASCSAMMDCPGGEAMFEVELAPGMHTLKATAEAFISIAESEPVDIVVEEDPVAATSTGADDPTTGGDTDTGDTEGAGDTDGTGGAGKDDGCGCRGAAGPAGALAWLGVVALGLRRRSVKPDFTAR